MMSLIWSRPRARTLGLTGLASLLWLGSAIGAEQSMYRCQDGDQVIYSQEPCGPDAQALELRYGTPTPAEAAAAEARVESETAATNQAMAEIERQRRIDELQQQLTSLHEARERAVAEHLAAIDQGTQDPDDNTYRERNAAALAELRASYADRIRLVEMELETLRMPRGPQ